MVRKDQVGAAAMDVERLAEIAPRHRAALDVPAGPAAAPRTVPSRQIGRRRLPQHEVAGIALVGRHVDPRAGQQLVRAASRQMSIRLETRHREQHMALRRIGMAGGDQPLDDLDHLRDVFRGARLLVRRQHAECRHVGMEVRRGARGDRADRLAALLGARVDLVVHVGDVAHVGDARIQHAQQPREHVEHHHGARIADMRQVVDRRSAHVHPHMLRLERLEPLLPAAQAVVQKKRVHRILLQDTDFLRQTGRQINGARQRLSRMAERQA